jgi:hypothetical protein
MKTRFCANAVLGVLLLTGIAPAFSNPLDEFTENTTWRTTSAASAVGDKLQIADRAEADAILYNGDDWSESSALVHKAWLGDSVITLEYLIPGDTKATLFLQGRYAIELDNNDNEWNSLRAEFRAPRFDAAHNKTANALVMEVRINGDIRQKNLILREVSPGAPIEWEGDTGTTAVLANKGPMALRNFSARPADFNAITMPEKSGGPTNEKQLVDFVALGKDKFQSVGCNVCHSTEEGASSKSGPPLFGLFMGTPREREIVEGEGHRFTIKADNNYLHSSLRTPAAQLAVAESGGRKDQPYPAFMPPFSAQVLSDRDINAIGAYLATLNHPQNQGPVIKLMSEEGQQAYNPVDDDLQLLVDDRTRIQRGPLPGVSGRAIHVGQPNSVNYSFDPRILGIAKLWQGGFLDMSGEFQNRGGKGLEIGYESREIDLGSAQTLFAPLNTDGDPIDFSFKSAKFGDTETVRQSLYSQQDHLDRLTEEDAQFLGYELNSKNKDAAPVFDYRIGKNHVAVQTSIAANGDTRIEISGQLKDDQSFIINPDVLKQAEVSTGKLHNGRWTLDAGTPSATLTGRIGLADKAWHPPASEFDYQRQPVKITDGEADLPRGYSIQNYYPPLDNFGREQLFEALGLALAEDGTLVVATRTAGVWRVVDGQWQLFSEGTFDTLGVQIEDKKGLQIVVSQKAELTRISDTNGDARADHYQTLFDAHSYHGNYHSYMHGPARGKDGAYYIGLNLAHADESFTYKAGGAYMGANGGFAGWSIRVEPEGDFDLWAKGMRSPAGIGLSPNDQLWYAENQGEYVGTSRLFKLEEDSFYGHPAGLVDLPGMTPDSEAIQWDKVAASRERPAILFPHNRVANSPGNPAWDTTDGKFGPFAGQMLIGDQTQSNLLRVDIEVVNGVTQGSVMPFIQGLESGVMRPLFLKDGSLLLGQTGRGWQAKGGHLASLQRIRWDGKTVAPAIHSVHATSQGFRIDLTRPLADEVDGAPLKAALTIASWVYRDASDYGSDELDFSDEAIAGVAVGADRKSINVRLQQLEHDPVHPQQTARVYYLVLASEQLFDTATPAEMEAYYTLYQFDK